MRKKQTSSGKLLVFLSMILVVLGMLFLIDNKYYTDTPLPQNGMLTLTQEQFEDAPIFLIDEWRFYSGEPDALGMVSGVEGIRTWIGEFSNYRFYNDPTRSPYGSGVYTLQVTYEGETEIAALFFPNLCHEYQIWWDDTLLGEGTARAYEHIYLTAGTHTIRVRVSGNSGYYTGMYFPGAIGSDTTIFRLIMIQSVIYGIAALVPFVLAVFCLSLWLRSGDVLRKYFAYFCICFLGSLSHYFLQFWQSPLTEFRFLISDIALYGMFYFAIMLMLTAANIQGAQWKNILLSISIGIPLVEIVLYLLAPLWYDAISLHGFIQNVYRVFLFASLLWGGIQIQKQEGLPRFLLYCDSALGVGILINLFASNLFEPMYGLWQFEVCSFLLVVLFAIYLETYNRELIFENQRYRQRLEELVEERTSKLEGVLDERRAFFSDMAHDLKAPLSSIKAFMYMIRSQKIEVDDELSIYLEQVDLQLKEMSQRVGSLNELNAVDQLEETAQTLTLNEILEEFYHTHNPEAVVSGIHLLLSPLQETVYLRVQKKKLMLAFENLFYNALRFTPLNGSITLEASVQEKNLCITMKDTGCGVPPEELPHIFERFYMGNYGKQTGGSGLGLYIVRMILKEHGGEIAVESEIEKGTVFTILLPLAERENKK